MGSCTTAHWPSPARSAARSSKARPGTDSPYGHTRNLGICYRRLGRSPPPQQPPSDAVALAAQTPVATAATAATAGVSLSFSSAGVPFESRTHIILSYRVLEASGWPKTDTESSDQRSRCSATSRPHQHAAPLASKGAARSTAACALLLAPLLTYAPSFCPFYRSSSSSGALDNNPHEVRRTGRSAGCQRGSGVRHASSIAASSAESGVASSSTRRNAHTPPPLPVRQSSSSPPLLSQPKVPPAPLQPPLPSLSRTPQMNASPACDLMSLPSWPCPIPLRYDKMSSLQCRAWQRTPALRTATATGKKLRPTSRFASYCKRGHV